MSVGWSKKGVAVLLSLTVCLFRVTLAFECSDGCVIPDSYLNDDCCDCGDCGDEDSFTCDLCPGCPQSCGQHTMCNVPTLAGFNCTDGCQIAGSKVDDGNCDCSDCADEHAFSCDSCLNGCPESCGDSAICSLLTSTTTHNPLPIEKEVVSDNYKCVNESKLVPWWWIATMSLWHLAKIMWMHFTTIQQKQDVYTENMWCTRNVVLCVQFFAFIVVFLLDSLRFHRKRNDGLNGWQQYTCFAEIWMFSSNAQRVFAIVATNVMSYSPSLFKLKRVHCHPTFIHILGAIQNVLPTLVMPFFLLYLPIYVTHMLPMAVLYCWVASPLIIFMFLFHKSEYCWFKMLVLLFVMLSTVLWMFIAALAFNLYSTGHYLDTFVIVLYERKTKDFLSSAPLGTIFFKFVIWLF